MTLSSFDQPPTWRDSDEGGPVAVARRPEVVEAGGGPERATRSKRRALIAAVGALLLCAYLAGALIQAFKVNLPIDTKNGWWYRTDQGAYMAHAKAMRESGYEYVGERNRMPVYPFLQSLAWNPSLSDHAFFRQGKLLNIAGSVVLLGLLFLAARRLLPMPVALMLPLITAFSVFVFKAGYFQCEVLYYFLVFCAFVLLVGQLMRPSPLGSLIAGGVAALAWLTKSSIMPMVLLFLGTSAVLALAELARRTTANPSASLRRVASMASFAAVFLLLVWPYIHTSKQVYGRYFYNVNSTFYVWCDSWAEVCEGPRAAGDHVHWPDMPAEQVPSARKYFREHDLADVGLRFAGGMVELGRRVGSSPGYAKYVFLYGAFCLLLLLQNRATVARAVLARTGWAPIAFVALLFTGYPLLFAWYTPIDGGGDRLLLMLFVPLLFILLWVLSRPEIASLRLRFAGQRIATTQLHAVAALLVLLDALFVVPTLSTTVYWGL